MLEYIELAKQSPPHSRGRTSVPCLRGHMFKSLFTASANAGRHGEADKGEYATHRNRLGGSYGSIDG